jgi:uncharacterized membrane protein
MFGQTRHATRGTEEDIIVTSLPLHPAIVHLPLGLAFLMPLLAAGFAWALWRGRARSRAWLAIVALQAILLGAGLVAMNTGEREEDRVERIVPEAAMERHEEYAEQFVWATGLTLGLAALAFAFARPDIRRGLTLATVAGTVVVMGAAVRVGHAGGELVYVHNAGAAYTPAAASTTAERESDARPTDEHAASEKRKASKHGESRP